MLSRQNLGHLIRAIYGESFEFSDDDSIVGTPIVEEVLGTLTPREEKVIKMGFGLGLSQNTHTQTQVAAHFGVSKRRIQQIEAKALRKLRHPSRTRKLKNILRILSDPEQAEALDLSGLSLTDVPQFILKFRNIRALWLGSNELKSLPTFIAQFRNLRQLYLDLNAFTEVPGIVGELRHLSTLSLSAIKLEVFPEIVLPNLEFLNLSNNLLFELPDHIGRFANLSELQLANNMLAALPSSIGQLKRLRILDLSSNRLAGLPESIGHLSELQRLVVSYNELLALPESMRNLTALKELYLHQTGLPDLPIELLGPTQTDVTFSEAVPAKAQDILEYYFRVRGGWRPLNEAKLILVGRGAVGKTSIVNRLVHNVFNKEEKTEGIKITEWVLAIDNEDVRLNIWDFGGQEIMHATHQLFLTQRSLYLLVLNGREGGEDADAEYWLRLIESFGGESPVIVVLNKIKEHSFDLNRRALQQKYPVVREFVKMDCKDGVGSQQLRKAIERETSQLEHLHDPFPSSWFAIKDQLAHKRKNFLSFDDYRKLCSRLGERNQHSQDTLAFYLHSLGVAVNFKDDPRLRDTHVLSPHWITHGIYKILNSQLLSDQKGLIQLSDLPNILDGRKYPVAMHRFLLDLMKKFELCFSFPEEDTKYLIPELLDKQEPKETEQFMAESGLNFRYDYPILPEGLIPRFIVRTHVLSEDLPRWRTGVIVAFDGCRALVKADMQDKRVSISVSGAASRRRRLLAVIRSDFERIHRDIRNLEPEEMVPLPNFPTVVVPYKELFVMEQKEITSFPRVVGDQVIRIDVDELLNGVDMEGIQRTPRLGLTDIPKQPRRLFYSYSHKDENLRNRLETHLKLLNRLRLIETWHDRKIEAGEDWKKKIDENLERADIILLLVSADFIASDYCYEKEMKRALERHESKEARVIPVIIRDVNWTKAPFAGLEPLPKDGKAVTKWSNRESAWRSVSEGIERVVEDLNSPPF